MTRPAHPGSIVFVDEQAKTEKTLPVAQVPESVAWGVRGRAAGRGGAGGGDHRRGPP